MNRTGNWARRGLRNWLLACLGVFAVLAVSDAAWALTFKEQSYVNVIRKYRPDIAGKLESGLSKLEITKRPDLTKEQRQKARRNVIEKQLKAARTAEKAAETFGTDQQKWDARKVAVLVHYFKDVYLGEGGGVAGSEAREVEMEEKRLRDEARKTAEKVRKKHEEERKKAEQKQKESSGQPSPDGQSSSPTVPGNDFYAYGRFGLDNGPGMPFLATESLGVLQLGAVKFEPRGTQTGFQAGGRVRIADNTSPLPRDRVFFNYNFFHNGFDDSQSLGNLFTNGAGLGIPGTGDPLANFPAGVFLPYAGGLNTVDNLFGNYDYSTIGGGVAVGTVFDVGNGITVAPFAGVDFASANQDTRLGGQIPGFNLDFVYNTDINAFQLSPNVGAEVIIPLIVNPDGGTGPNVTLQVISRVFVDTLFFDGSDRLDLSGIVNDAQQVSLGGSDSNIGFSLQANVIVQRIFDTPVNLIVGGFVQQRQLVSVINRSGEVGEKSEAKAGALFSAGANFGAVIPF